jgi:hypothetical protein
VAKHKELRLSLNNKNLTLDRKSVKKDIDLLKNKIRKRLKDINNDVAKTLADEIALTDSSRRMFEAVHQLADRKKPPNICVKNDDGVTVGCDVKKAEILRDYFEKQYNNGEEALDAFVGPLQPLGLPISSVEVE